MIRPADIPAPPAARSWLVTIAGLRACEYAHETFRVVDTTAEQLHVVIGDYAARLGFVRFEILHTISATIARLH